MDKRRSQLRTRRALPVELAEHFDALDSPVISDAIRSFLFAKTSERAAKRTVQGYESSLRYMTTWIQTRHDGIRLGEITSDMIREYIAWMSNEKERYDDHPYKMKRGIRGLSPSTVNVRIRSMKVFFNWCVNESYIRKSPLAGVKLQRVDNDRVTVFTADQVRSLLSTPDLNTFVGFRDYVIMMMLLDTGLRISELFGLTVDNVDLHQMYVTVPWEKAKTRKTRVIPISPSTGKLLATLMRENEDFGPNVTHLFYSGMGRAMSPASFDERLREYGRHANVTGTRVSPHTFRHTFALHWIKSGGDPFSLQKILGHTDMSMVRRYVRLSDRDVKEKHDVHSPVRTLFSHRKPK